MREYLDKISLTKNSRGVYCLDTSIGCASGMLNNKRGCYNDCYSAKSAKIYGYDFSKTVLRYFKNRKHEIEIINEINKSKLDFIRIGASGDPSENWKHTINIIKVISRIEKEIVIITKHWNNLTTDNLKFLSTLNICINTSVSALDKFCLLSNRIKQYKRIKQYCKSVLRIVSANFNLKNETGKRLAEIQSYLFKNENTLDTVLRVDKNNELIRNGIINIFKTNFLGSKTYASKFNNKTYLGKCSTCLEMCGIRFFNNNKWFIPKQLNLFNA